MSACSRVCVVPVLTCWFLCLQLTSSDGAHSMQSAFQPSISIGLHKPTVFDSIIPMDVKLRTFSERLDPTMGFHTKVSQPCLTLLCTKRRLTSHALERGRRQGDIDAQ